MYPDADPATVAKVPGRNIVEWMAFLGLPQLKAEGAATAFDNNAGERYIWNFVHQEVALGYSITRKAIDDNLYKAQFSPTNLKLQEYLFKIYPDHPVY